jgi:hypothetical protein
MLIMRATDEAIEASKQVPFEEIINAMGAYNESLIKAGVRLAGEGLSGPEEGFVVDFSAEEPIVTDGPYGETHELFAPPVVDSGNELVAKAQDAGLGCGDEGWVVISPVTMWLKEWNLERSIDSLHVEDRVWFKPIATTLELHPTSNADFPTSSDLQAPVSFHHIQDLEFCALAAQPLWWARESSSPVERHLGH